MLDQLLEPIVLEDILDAKKLQDKQWGREIHLYTNELPKLKDYQLAIVGVDVGDGTGVNAVRKSLYQLYNWHSHLKVVDLGNIKTGATTNDTYFALSEVVSDLLDNRVIPIILGGTHDHTYGQFLGYKSQETVINMVVIDQTIDLQPVEEDVIKPDSFLYKILSHQSNYLRNFAQVGYQHYLVNTRMVDTLEYMNFECFRLASFKDDIKEVEPIVRDAHLVSFDLAAVCQSDAPGVLHRTPNGFLGQEACRISRYTGLSDRVSSIGFYGLEPANDRDDKTTNLVAQMIWHFVEGVYNRKNEFPEFDAKHCYEYIVDFQEMDYDLIFLRSKKSERWWMKIALPNQEGIIEYHIIPCSYSDYKNACNKEIPDRWMRAFEQLSNSPNHKTPSRNTT